MVDLRGGGCEVDIMDWSYAGWFYNEVIFLLLQGKDWESMNV